MRRLIYAMMLLCLSAAAQAQYFACVDKHGNTTYQADPCKGEGVHQREVKIAEKPGQASPGPGQAPASVAIVTDSWGGTFLARFQTGLNNILARAGIRDGGQMGLRFNQMRQKQPWILSVVLAMYVYSVWYSLRLLVLAFQQGFWWGMLYLFVPLIGFVVVLVRFWSAAGRLFLLSFGFAFGAGLLFMLAPL